MQLDRSPRNVSPRFPLSVLHNSCSFYIGLVYNFPENPYSCLYWTRLINQCYAYNRTKLWLDNREDASNVFHHSSCQKYICSNLLRLFMRSSRKQKEKFFLFQLAIGLVSTNSCPMLYLVFAELSVHVVRTW
jgi:hypothetical protein